MVWEQARVLAVMTLCGACMGAVNDMLGVLRRGCVMTACMDLLLGVVLGAMVISAALVLQCDAFRIHIFAGVALGWGIYVCSLGTFVRILKEGVIELSKKGAK